MADDLVPKNEIGEIRRQYESLSIEERLRLGEYLEALKILEDRRRDAKALDTTSLEINPFSGLVDSFGLWSIETALERGVYLLDADPVQSARLHIEEKCKGLVEKVRSTVINVAYGLPFGGSIVGYSDTLFRADVFLSRKLKILGLFELRNLHIFTERVCAGKGYKGFVGFSVFRLGQNKYRIRGRYYLLDDENGSWGCKVNDLLVNAYSCDVEDLIGVLLSNKRGRSAFRTILQLPGLLNDSKRMLERIEV